MKRLIYKVAYIVAVVMVIASSCTKQDLREEPSLTSKNPIEVRSYSVGSGTQVHTKSAIYGSTMPTDRDLVISAYYNAADEGTDAEFFKNYLFSYSSVKQTWTSAEKPAYWPLKGTLDFLAYSSEDAQLQAQWNEDNCASEVVLGSFKESQSLSDDLLFAKANGQSYSASGVPMEFSHAKSLIVFTAKSSNADAITITKIEINGLEQIDNAMTQLTVLNNGEEPASAEWNKSYKAAADVVVPGIDGISYSVPVKAMDVTKKSSYLGIGGQGIMVPEQEMKSFTVYFEQNCALGEPLEQSFTYNCQIGEEGDWEMGKRYIYELNFKVNEFEVSPIVEPWDEGAEDVTTPVDIPEAASFKATTASAGEEFSLPTMTLTDGTKVIIDWADGTTPDEYIYVETKASPIEVGEDGVLDASHTYTAAGTYLVKIYVSEDGHVDMGELDKSIYDLITVKIPERFSVKSNMPDGNIHFEDPLFKAYCVENFDQDGDGEVSFEEALGVTEMEFDTNGMTNLIGIEHFIDLERLSCCLDFEEVYLEEYDDQKHAGHGKMHFYDKSGNEVFGLESMDLSKNIKLKKLDSFANQLRSLDLSKNTELDTLYCIANLLQSLNVSGCKELKSLDCQYNDLTSLDLSGNMFMNSLYCNFNYIQGLDLSDKMFLTKLYCNHNGMTELNLKGAVSLGYLECNYNNVKSVDLSTNIELRDIEFYHTYLESLDVSQNTELETLYCIGEKNGGKTLKSIVFGDNNKLYQIECDHHQLSELDLSGLTALETLSCTDNQLTSIDLSGVESLSNLNCEKNQLASLDLSTNSSLSSLYCENNLLTSLDLSTNSGLSTLSCENNQLTALDVSSNLSLRSLSCDPMPTLATIYLAEGQEIHYLDKPETTEIVYK